MFFKKCKGFYKKYKEKKGKILPVFVLSFRSFFTNVPAFPTAVPTPVVARRAKKYKKCINIS